MVEDGTFGIEGGYFLHDEKLYFTEWSFAKVHNVHLHTLQQFAFAYGVERFQIHRPEDNTRYAQAVQAFGKFLRFHPCSGKHLERNRITYSDRHVV
ncbi:unknown [Bacteroides eggerthii CAG:109]|nr:unknown [Bacteroides eggerthii CAG:109]